MTSPRNGVPTVIVVAILVIFCFTVSSVVALAIAGPSNETTSTLISSLVGLIPTTIASLAVLMKVNTVERKVDDANRALNGEMDAKIQRNVSETLQAHGVPQQRKPPKA